MSERENYKGSIELISGIKPKNNADFPLVHAHDVQVDENGKRLDTKLSELSAGIGVGDGSGASGFIIGNGLKLDAATNTLSVDTATEVESDNTKPITSAAVHTVVGNINALLETI